jgi:hypothetical protein
VDSRLHTELWTSWASLLRSYAAAHGLNSSQHAVIEVSAEEITFRVGSRWMRFTPTVIEHSGSPPMEFMLTQEGDVRFGEATPEEMDFAAERIAREMMNG